MILIFQYGNVVYTCYLYKDDVESIGNAIASAVTNLGRLNHVSLQRLDTGTVSVRAFFKRGAVTADIFRADGTMYGIEIDAQAVFEAVGEDR